MDKNILIGLGYALVAGIFAGSFSFPMKLTRGWKWHHNWVIFAIWALFIMPIITALYFIPNLWQVYQGTDTDILIKVFFFGMIWGIGVICFGLGLEYLGIALGMSIMLGLMISLGAIFPIILYQPQELMTSKGIDIIIGSLIILGGIILCSIAGSKRSKAEDGYKPPSFSSNKAIFLKGLVIAILAGLLSTMQNVGFVAGNSIQMMAINLGASSLNAGNSVWPVLMAGCLIVNVAFCIYLISKYKEWKLFLTKKKWYWAAIAASGIIWFLCMMFFGMAASKLGKLGASIGWASFQTIAIIAGNVVGFLTGEWKNSNRRLLVINGIGIILLVIGVVVLAF